MDYNLPATFKLEFTLRSTNLTQNPSVAIVRFNNSSGVWCGKGSHTSGTIYFLGGTTFGSIRANTDYNYVLTYDGSLATLTDGTTTKSSNQTLTKLYELPSWDNAKLSNVKIKPL